MIQAKVDLKGGITDSDLFVDASFPPDRSSLTYVYSGDDKYERTVFRRPKVSLVKKRALWQVKTVVNVKTCETGKTSGLNE